MADTAIATLDSVQAQLSALDSLTGQDRLDALATIVTDDNIVASILAREGDERDDAVDMFTDLGVQVLDGVDAGRAALKSLGNMAGAYVYAVNADRIGKGKRYANNSAFGRQIRGGHDANDKLVDADRIVKPSTVSLWKNTYAAHARAGIAADTPLMRGLIGKGAVNAAEVTEVLNGKNPTAAKVAAAARKAGFPVKGKGEDAVIGVRPKPGTKQDSPNTPASVTEANDVTAMLDAYVAAVVAFDDVTRLDTAHAALTKALATVDARRVTVRNNTGTKS